MNDHLAFIRDDHLRTVITALDKAVVALLPAVSAGRKRVQFKCPQDLVQLANLIATAADTLADIREQNLS
jgi:hypothetical protein